MPPRLLCVNHNCRITHKAKVIIQLCHAQCNTCSFTCNVIYLLILVKTWSQCEIELCVPLGLSFYHLVDPLDPIKNLILFIFDKMIHSSFHCSSSVCLILLFYLTVFSCKW